MTVTVSVAVSVAEGSGSGSGSGKEPAARPRHGHPRVVHTDQFEQSVEPQRHGEGAVPTADNGKGERQNRRAPGTADGEKRGGDERSCSELAALITGGRRSDRLPFFRHDAGEHPIPAPAPLRLCAFASLRLCVFGRVGGSAPLRLCASALFGWAGGFVNPS